MKKKQRKRVCAECGRGRERCREAVLRLGEPGEPGVLDVVCPRCWRELGYEEFMVRKAHL